MVCVCYMPVHTCIFLHFSIRIVMCVKAVTDRLKDWLEVSTRWCSWGDSMGHEWLQPRQNEAEREPAAGVQWITMYSQSGGVGGICFSRNRHSLHGCIAASCIFFFKLLFNWLDFCTYNILHGCVKECIYVYYTYKLQCRWSLLADWKIGHILSHVWRSACSASGLILCRTLCVAHSNTRGDPPLRVYWFHRLACARRS